MNLGPIDPNETNKQLADLIASCHHNPLRFVLKCYPWRERNTMLESHYGPDLWQRQFLKELGEEVRRRAFNGRDAVMPIRRAVSKGHGVGGSTMAAWLCNWIMSTRPGAQGTVTANTSMQLETKTWASVMRWTKLCLTGHWFEINTQRMYHPAFKESWFCTPQTCREENSEAFAGQHAEQSTSFYIFDESAGIPAAIWTVAEGGLTDGEPMIFAFGNMTRSQGEFHSRCFGAKRELWKPLVVDSRTSRFTNKQLIEEWIAEHGEDSDFVRVRVRGLPPRASDVQFIDQERVFAAQKRQVDAFSDEPLLCGLDVARGGSARCVFRFRRGADARTIPPIVVPAEEARNAMVVVTKAADLLERTFAGRKIEMLFVDASGGLGGAVVDRLHQLGHDQRVLEINFGAQSPDPHYANMRAYMWAKCRDWLARGAIDPSPVLEQDLTGPDFKHDSKDRLLLESKEKMLARGLASPDDADALCLTFAVPVVARLRRERKKAKRQRFEGRSAAPDAGPLSWMG